MGQRFTREQRERIRLVGDVAERTGERDCITLNLEHGAPVAWQGLSDRQARGMLRYVWFRAGYMVSDGGEIVSTR